MEDGDVLGPALERRIFWGVEPLEGELAVVDPLDGGEPEALEFPLLVPVGGQDPRADPQGLSSGGAVRLADRGRSRGCTRGSAAGEVAVAALMFMFCSDMGLVVAACGVLRPGRVGSTCCLADMLLDPPVDLRGD